MASEEQNRAKRAKERRRKRRRENSGAEQREGDGSRAERPSSGLPVCLHSRAAAASTSVAPSGSPPPSPLPRSPLLSLLLSFYLPVVPFNNPGACWYAEQRWRVQREEWMEGGKQRGGEQRVCFWRMSAAHMLSKES